MVAIFMDDDNGYLRWIAANPGGFVLNCDRKPHARYLKLQHVSLSSNPHGNNPRKCLTGTSKDLLHFYPNSIISWKQLYDAVRGLEDGR